MFAGSMASQWSPSSSPSPSTARNCCPVSDCNGGHHRPVHDLLRVHWQGVRERDGSIFVVLELFSSGIFATLLLVQECCFRRVFVAGANMLWRSFSLSVVTVIVEISRLLS